MLPPAPALFSITNGCLSALDIFSQMILANVSSGPGTVDSWLRSQRIAVNNPGGYAFVGQQKRVEVLDVQLKGEPGVEQVVKSIDVGQYVIATAASADLARVFVATHDFAGNTGGVAVIDGVSLKMSKFIALPTGQWPTSIALDPNGRYAYVSVQGAVFVIDIDPGSQNPYQVDTIPIATATGRILDTKASRTWQGRAGASGSLPHWA